MNFLKALFGGNSENSEEKKKEEEAKNFDVLKFDGVRALRGNEMDYAIKCFTHALELKEDLEVRDYLSQAYTHNNELLPAFEQLQKLAEAQPDNQEIFIRMANVAFMMEDYGAMADSCEKAELINKENPLVSYLYARACLGQDDMVNAIAMLTKAIALKEDYGDAYLLRGETLLKMGDVNGAEEDVAYLMEHVKDNEDVLLLKARVEAKKGNADEAIKIYNSVIDANPFSLPAFKERGALRLQQGDKDGAEEDMKQVLELDPNNGADVSGNYSAEGVEAQVRKAYKENNPFGLG
jgi:tetratricopeptide (TPR) repeat protein